MIIIFIFSLFFVTTSYTDTLPSFFKFIEKEAFFPHGMDDWKLQKNIEKENSFILQWENSSQHAITLKYRNATPRTIQGVYKGLGEEVDENIKRFGGKILAVNEYFAIIIANESPSSHSVNIFYGTPDGAYWWKYRVPNTFETDHSDYINDITSVARKHQFDIILKYGNVEAGKWGVPIHEYAKLSTLKNDPLSASIYKILLQSNPANYDAHIEYTLLTKDKDEVVQSALIVEKNAEEERLLTASAKLLNKDISSISSYPLLDMNDKGLKVILIPLSPCNPWILDEVADTYKKITGIPVVIKRLPVNWTVPEPSRSVYRPSLEAIASNIWKTKYTFSDWSLSKLKEEIMKKAKEEGPGAVLSINQLFKRMDESGYQWEADPIMNWLSQALVPYFSKDPNTMVVGITELDIFSGETNFLFSLYGGRGDLPVSILSYARMKAKLTGENQSRNRLRERVAKELVPASLKKLGIPRSVDPSCPYSYSSGLQRLEEKTLTLSEPVKLEIEKRKNSIEQ